MRWSMVHVSFQGIGLSSSVDTPMCKPWRVKESVPPITPPLRGSREPSRQAKADAVGGWRATSQKADVHPLGNSRLPAALG